MTMAPPFLWLVWTPAPPAPRPDADHGAASAGDKAADARPVRRACDPLPILEAIRGRRRRRMWFQATPRA
jgi:hypothetical protein